MSDLEFASILAWFMCSDPWPTSDMEHNVIHDWLDRESEARGFENWIVAYHDPCLSEALREFKDEI